MLFVNVLLLLILILSLMVLLLIGYYVNYLLSCLKAIIYVFCNNNSAEIAIINEKWRWKINNYVIICITF